MPIDYHYDHDLKAVICEPTGRIEKDDIINYFSRLLTDKSVPSGFIEIVDLSGVEEFAISYQDAPEMAAKIGSLVAIKGYKYSYLFAPNDAAYKFISPFPKLAEDRGLKIEIFRDWEEMMASIQRKLQKE
jgi:hypothetical protein